MTTQAFNLSQFANYLNSSGQVSAAGIQAGVTLESGTIGLYYQTSAPTGWTQVTTLNDYALRIVSSAGGTTGGTTAFSTVFTNQTPTISNTLGLTGFSVGATTLSTAQIPSHTHNVTIPTVTGCGATQGYGVPQQFLSSSTSYTSTSTGGGGSHTHSITTGTITGGITSSAITLNVRYANIILCSKN